MTVTKSIINDGEIVDYTKSHVPYMDSRFLCSISADEEPAPTVAAPKLAKKSKAVEASQPLWIDSKAADLKLAVKNTNPPIQQTLKLDTYSSSFQQNYNVTVTAKPLEKEDKCDPCTNDPDCAKHNKESNDVALAVRDALILKKDVLSSLDEKTAEIKATIKTIDWVLSLFNGYP